jgi:hypothetical protein
VFRGPRLPKTYLRLIGSAKLVVKEVTIPTSAPIRVSALLKQLCLHLHLTVEPTPSRTMHVGESTMLLGRKPKKLQTLSLVCFLLVTLLQLMLTSTPTHNQISGLINRARVRQLNNQVSSFLASYSSYLDNGNMCSVLLLRNDGQERNEVAFAPAAFRFQNSSSL